MIGEYEKNQLLRQIDPPQPEESEENQDRADSGRPEPEVDRETHGLKETQRRIAG